MKKYYKPTTRIVELHLMGSCLNGYGLRGGSFGTTGGVDASASRQSNPSGWDDEEEEENTGGWFK